MNSIFKIYRVNVKCPEYSTLSKRLEKLKIPVPQYRISRDKVDNNIITSFVVERLFAMW